MDLKNYKTWLVLVALLVIGCLIGRVTKPEKVVTKTVTQTVTVTQVKTVEVDKTDYYKDRILIETSTTKPDGTIIKQREFIDKSSYHQDNTITSNTQTNTTTNSSTETSKIYSTGYQGSVKVLYARNLNNFNSDIYGLEVDKKLIGSFTVGAFGLTDKTLGLSLGINF